MKYTLCFLLLLVTNISLADEGEKLLRPSTYMVLSDDIDSSVPEGMCRIKGFVRCQQEILVGAMVSVEDHEIKIYTDSLGHYQMDINLSDTIVYAFKTRYNESVVENYEFREGHLVQIDFDLARNISKMNVKKPVIYCYSDQALNAEIRIEPKGELAFTYPSYNEKWEIQIDKDNKLFADGQEVPYLFWDGFNTIGFDLNDEGVVGNIVNGADLVQFFEKELSDFGLNRTETTDFISFWVPQLQDSDRYFIQFKTGVDYEKQIGRIEVTPEPDHILRLFALIEPLSNTQFRFSPQTLENNERNGFTVVEWGGAISNSKKSL